jgi:5-methyltetrahydrofolate--homocysteine methyltransferase
MIPRSRLATLLSERVLVLDGAMGTMLLRKGLTEADVRGARFTGHRPLLLGNLDLLVVTQPHRVSDVHDAYLAAGADVVRTNTFCSDAHSQAAYGLRALSYEISVTAARLARDCADGWTARTPRQPRFVAGVIGPSRGPVSAGAGQATDTQAETGSADPHPDHADAGHWAYRDQARGLLDGGVDIVLVETVVDVGNARAAMAALGAAFAASGRIVPVMLSMTPRALLLAARAGSPASHRDERGARLARRDDRAAEAMVEGCEAALGRPLTSVGLNCGRGSADAAAGLPGLAVSVPTLVSCHPSAGMPDAAGRYPESPHVLAAALGDLAKAGWLNVVGGCCGTTPDHIRVLAAAVEGIRPRRMPAPR